MAKLNQIIAVEKGVKSRSYSEFSELYKLIQKPDLFNGFTKAYEKRDDDDAELPSEKRRVQLQTGDVLRKAALVLSELFQVTARKDWTNCAAVADIKLDGNVIVAKAPVSFLLFLEKQLTDIRFFVNAIPVLDESEEWELDKNSGLYRTGVVKTHRTKKIQKALVLIQPTAEHPGQAEKITEDVIAGYWNLVQYSGALPNQDRRKLLHRTDALLKAVKEAREEANVIQEISVPNVAESVFNYLLGDN